ncbi:uncharacterized protein LOC113514534 [Galleria mellonella]|uniref:Uncharacterized protein LOC113514534 n=1 Tax=Galleria mellonella TaxID=7137 RepID=A0A6J3BRT8_GALME|nr:uncharacterized protein LOC113514534 [Galleria mellonella]
MLKYHKNFILYGELEYFCIVCREEFLNIEDVEKHIRWEKHRKIMKRQTLFPKLKQDSIYKIGNNFYCELCNYLTSDMENIMAHLNEEKHKTNRKSKTPVIPKLVECKRDVDTGFIIVHNVIVSIRQWNTFVNLTHCMLCDTVVDLNRTDEHIVLHDHLIKLIQARVILENEGRCYRKINKDINYCFICKTIVGTSDLNDHWNSVEHCANKTSSIATTSKTTETKTSKEIYRANETTKKLLQLQRTVYDINLENKTATCKFCNKIIPFLGREMLNHQKEHAEELRDIDDSKEMLEIIAGNVHSSDSEASEVGFSETIDHGKRRHKMSLYGKQHYITLTPVGAKGYCHLCHVYMSSHIKVFREHTRGHIHKGHLEFKGLKKGKKHEKPDCNTKSLQSYLKNIFYSHAMRSFWINEELSVKTYSFILIAPIRYYKKTKCYACDVEYKQGEAIEHYKTIRHKTNLLDTEVVTYLRGEFIREIRNDLYHCGFCNRLFAYWDNMKRHMRSWRHKEMKKDRIMASNLARKWKKDNLLTVISTNPDIMYVQLLDLDFYL